MTNQLSFLYASLKDFFDPLRRHLSGAETLEYLFYRYGWNIPLDDTAFNTLDQLLGIKTPLEQLLEKAGALQDKLNTNGNTFPVADLPALLESAHQLISILANINVSSLTTLPPPLKDGALWKDISDHLLDDLMETYLRIYQPNVYLFLHLFGVIRYEEVPANGPHRISYTRTLIDWNQGVEIVKNPLQALKQTYHWDHPTKDFEHQRLLAALEKILRANRISARLTAPNSRTLAGIPANAPYRIQPNADALKVVFLYNLSQQELTVYEIGLEILPALKNGQNKASGLLLKPVLRGGAGKEFIVSKDFVLRAGAGADAGNSLGVVVFPDFTELAGGQPQLTTKIEFTNKNTSPWYLLGNSKTSRIELSGLSISLSLEGAVNDLELKLHLKTGKADNKDGCKVIIPLEESDEFIKDTVSKPAIEFAFSAEMIWSNKTGLRFNGESTFDIELPANIKLGPLTLQHASIALLEGKKQGSHSTIDLRLSTGMHGKLGPISLTVEKMGFVCRTIPYSRQEVAALPPGTAPLLGNLDLQLNFAPPKGIGLEVNAQAVTGSGYLEFSPEKGEYFGIVQLSIKNKISANALGIIQTRLPDGKPGYSFLLMISAEFPAIQLGLGFSLTGVGGLVGIHRRIELQKIQEGLYNDAIDDILFPADPVKNAYTLLTKINQFFPPAKNQFTFGLMAQLAWGPKSIIRIEMGLILEFPEPVRLALVGVLKSEVTRKIGGKEIKALQLQVNFLGVIDFEKEFIRFDAALFQSKLLGMKLEGDMALRIKYGTNPDFIVTVGGFHPSYQPPALDLPAQMRRIQIILRSGNPSITVGCYLAVTSNTVQFGVAGLFVFNKWGVGIRGELSFDALFQLSPFRFVTDVHFLLAASWKGYDFASIEVNGTFAGPSPWSIKGSLRLKVWIFSKTVSLDETWGEEDESRQEKIRILPLLAEDLGNVSNWERATGRTRLAVTLQKQLKQNQQPAILTLHPNQILTVRQGIVPLGIQVDKFAARKPEGARTFNITLNNHQNEVIPGNKVKNHFATAQFIDLNEEQQLSAPPYELFDAGLSFEGLDDLLFDDDCASIPVSYETKTMGEAAPPPPPKETVLSFMHSLRNNALANSAFGQLPKAKIQEVNTIGEKYVIADQAALKATDIPAVSSEAEARQLLREINKKEPAKRQKLTVLPMAEALP